MNYPVEINSPKLNSNTKEYFLDKSHFFTLKKPGELYENPLMELHCPGNRHLIDIIIETQLHDFLQQFAACIDEKRSSSNGSQWFLSQTHDSACYYIAGFPVKWTVAK
jgi:hypothetical protein